MLKPVKIALLVGMSTAVMMASVMPAFAAGGWGNTDCSQVPNPGCELGAGQGPGTAPSPSGGGPGHGSGSGQGSPQQGAGDVIVGGGQNLATCHYVPSDFQPPPGTITPASYRQHAPGGVLAGATTENIADRGTASVVLVADPTPRPGGAWYVWRCTGTGFADSVYRPPVWIANGPTQAPSVVGLAEQAYRQLRLPAPTIAASPPAAQLVTLPTWLWLAGGWTTLFATAAVPGVSVTAVATPTTVTWSMGDGHSVTCTGPGTPYPEGAAPTAPSPTCGYTYHQSSATQPHGMFPVTVTLRWTVTWSGAGHSGTFPDLTTTATTPFTVLESPAVNTTR